MAAFLVGAVAGNCAAMARSNSEYVIGRPFTVAATSETVYESHSIRPIPDKRRLDRDYRHALALDHSYSVNKMIKHLVIDDLLWNEWLGEMASEEFWSIYSNTGKVCQVVRDLRSGHLRMHVTTAKGDFAVIIHRFAPAQ